jgi:tRNA (adenine57-N1/adenine58-N1)-methyltransferase
MIGHTGFLLTSRRMAEGFSAPERRRRPAPGAYGDEGEEGLSEESFGLRGVSDKKIRKVRRALGVPRQSQIDGEAARIRGAREPDDE